MSDSFVEGRITRPGGVEIAYYCYGEGTPLLLIMGWTLPASSWGPLPMMLAELGYRAITVDNRDTGKSSECEGIEYSIADMAGDSVAVLDELGLESSSVLGISMGGMIAQQIAIDKPERVTKLMLMATGPGAGGHGVPPAPELVAEMFAVTPEDDRASVMIRMIGKFTGPGFAERNPEVVQMVVDRGLETGSNPAGAIRQWQAISACDTWEFLPSIAIPTMIVHGADDPLVPFANGQNLASRIPGAELVSFPGVGHFVPLEEAQGTLSAIARFFPVQASVEAS